MGFFEDDEENDYGENPNEEVNNTSSKEEVKEKKQEEPKKKKMELEKKTHTSSDGLINIGKSQEILDDLNFMAQKLESATKEIKDIKHLSQIREHIENLQNITIDTSNFEKQFQGEIKKLTKKIISIVDNADLHELDEISSKIKDMNMTFKKQRYVSFFLISVFAYASGYLTSSLFPLENIIKQDEVTRIAKKAKENGVAFQKHKSDDVIAIPTKIGGTMSKNRKYIVYKIK